MINGRKWVTTESRDQSRYSFRIATYNVLSDLCIKSGEYEYCPPGVRYMPTRHVTIMAEVKDMSPDIICFQVGTADRALCLKLAQQIPRD